MGYDPKLFVSSVDDELKCPICQLVLEKPVSGTICGHLYCEECIIAWLRRCRSCPLDRDFLTEDKLKPAPRIIVNFIKNLEIYCPNNVYGCSWTIKIDDLVFHLSWCPFDDDNNCSSIRKSDNDKNQLQQLRNVCDKTSDICEMKSLVAKLKCELEDIVDCSEKFEQSIDKISQNTQDVVRYIQYAHSQLIRVLLCSEDQESLVKNLKLENCLFTVTIMNLSEFMSEDILVEYLRQNDMRPIKCVIDTMFSARSRNFRVTARLSEFDKLTNPNIWPVGVIVTINSDTLTSDRYVFAGKRSNQECKLVIEASQIVE